MQSACSNAIPRLPGTYVLYFRVLACTELTVGRLGTVRFAPGRYVYLGSALGPGGLGARIARHLRPDKQRHWHVDSLTPLADWQEVWWTVSTERLECAWARYFLSLPGASVPALRFGASDCRCTAHLIHLAAGFDFDAFRRLFPGARRLELTPSSE